jgi:hypothetical protein
MVNATEIYEKNQVSTFYLIFRQASAYCFFLILFSAQVQNGRNAPNAFRLGE